MRSFLRRQEAWMCRCVAISHASTLLRLYASLILLIICFSFFTLTPAFAKKAKVITPYDEYLYQQKALRNYEKEKYHRSLLPQSGYMTKEDYEELSKDVPNSDKVIPAYVPPRDIKMKYVPQPIYKLSQYNNPPGSPELHIERRFQFDRQMNCTGITSPNRDIMVYPTVYYYAINQCTACDLFVIPLDQSLDEVERVKRANIVKRIPTPILSTEKDISQKFTFRTMTPIDFSPDGSKLLAKEKIGNINDGIWQTNLWVYDFNTKQARNLSEIRDAIRFYWMNQENLVLDEKRWDIYPLGFDAGNPDRIIISAYGYTGRIPKFLGNWSIDCNGEQTLLVSLSNAETQVSVNGLKLVQSGIVEPAQVHSNEKAQDKAAKKKRKEAKKTAKQDLKKKKQALNDTLKEMKKEESKVIRGYKQQQRTTAPTGID